MKLYGLTIVNSDCGIIADDVHGNRNYRDSFTKLFASKQEVIDYAVSVVGTWFESYNFEDGLDQNERTLKDLTEELRKGEDIVIQASDTHCEFDFFVQDMPNLFNGDEYVTTKLWSKEGIKQKLIEKGFAGTDDQVKDVIDTRCLRTLNECTDSDWTVIDYAINDIERELVEENPDVKVTGINWDVDKDDFDTETEYEAAIASLPEDVTIPFSKLFRDYDPSDEDSIADYLSDEYGYCINGIESVDFAKEE